MNSILEYILELAKSNPSLTIIIIAILVGCCCCCCCLCYSNSQKTTEARELNEQYPINVLIEQESNVTQIEQQNLNIQIDNSLMHYNNTEVINRNNANENPNKKIIMCTICCQNQKNAFIMPCGHCECLDCLERIVELNNKCHICRKPIDEIKKLFL